MFTNIRPKKIIYSGVATIVYWQDGSKTVVKRSEGAPDDRYAAFCAALAKKLYNTNSEVKRQIRKAEEYKGKVVCARPWALDPQPLDAWHIFHEANAQMMQGL